MFHVKHRERRLNLDYIENLKKKLNNLITSRWCVELKESFSRLFGVLEKDNKKIMEIPVEQISPSPYQPRTIFDDQRLEELCQTIRVHGLIQPIVVRKMEEGYECIAGERRLRAVKKLGLPTIPAILKRMNDSQSASISLIENLQREELTAIEEAMAYQQLIEIHQLTQESLAQRLGKGQSTIANKLRLLHLPVEVQEELLKRTITERHARALLSLQSKELQLQVLQEILQRHLNVKQTEEWIRRIKGKWNQTKKRERKSFSRDIRIAINTIRQSIQMIRETGVSIETEETEKDDYLVVMIRMKNK